MTAVQEGDVVVAGECRLGHGAADEAGATDEEDAHAASLVSLASTGIRCRLPSTSVTLSKESAALCSKSLTAACDSG